jgi:hypothetical protein
MYLYTYIILLGVYMSRMYVYMYVCIQCILYAGLGARLRSKWSKLNEFPGRTGTSRSKYRDQEPTGSSGSKHRDEELTGLPGVNAGMKSQPGLLGVNTGMKSQPGLPGVNTGMKSQPGLPGVNTGIVN